jgi:hypothetical protein
MKWDHYGVFYPSYKPTVVKLVKEEGYPKDITVSFPAIQNFTRYKIYGSLSPTIRTLIKEIDLSQQDSSVIYNPDLRIVKCRIKFPVSKIILPEELIVHIWVSYLHNGQETFLQEDPATYFTTSDKQEETFNTYFKLNPVIPPDQASAPDYVKATIPYEMLAFYRDEIRRRHIAMMEIGGEEFILYKRRREGPVCPECVEPKLTGNVTQVGSTKPIPFDPTVVNDQVSPRFSGRSRCETCFGTGIIGGYYYPIRIKISYWGMPKLQLKLSEKGLEIDRVPDAWTLWTPFIAQHDVLHRVVSGERFVVKETKVSTWQGVMLRQGLTFECLDPDDIRVRINRDKITTALRKYNLIDTEEEIPLWI